MKKGTCRSRHIVVSAIISLLAFVQTSAIANNKAGVVFKNQTWKVAIDPATLDVRATAGGSTQPLLLSAAQPQAARVGKLHISPSRASWELLDRHISVSMRLENDVLVVDFTSQSPGDFTWPILPSQATNRAYILPLGEGVYAPAHDAGWSAYLAKQEGLSTTEQLSLPFWGVDVGAHVLTYLLTNPFNNQLTFRNDSGSLAARFTHQFTSNWRVKTYGLRISLGPASPIEPAKQYRGWLIQTGHFVSMQEKIRRLPEAAKLLGAAHIYLWGDGASPQMLDTLHASGLDRLWLGAPTWHELSDNPRTVQTARALGYLIGPYDSYDSVHSPNAKPDDTWETAQFDQKLYDTGGIVQANGKKKSGFQQTGFYLSEQAVAPYVKKRVARLMKVFGCNSWFIDCDAAGEFYDDYSPLHPANQKQEMQGRLKRLAWIRDNYHLTIGSEGGSAYSAETIHFAHGIMPANFGWGDPDLKDPKSPYFLGAYYPPGAPAVFFKQVPLKPGYYRFLFDPRFRLPLYQTVFHNSVITTHHWSSPTLKFSDQVVERSLMEALYNVPPLYHLNRAEFAKQGAWIKAEYAFFSPLHRKIGLLQLRDFAWLTPDHGVQRTTFGNTEEIVVNFRPKRFNYRGHMIKARSVLAIDRLNGKITTFTP